MHVRTSMSHLPALKVRMGDIDIFGIVSRVQRTWTKTSWQNDYCCGYSCY